MHGFPALGSIAVGVTPDEAAKILSDPTSIIQKGLYIIEPIINEAMKIKGLLDLVNHAVTSALCGLPVLRHQIHAQVRLELHQCRFCGVHQPDVLLYVCLLAELYHGEYGRRLVH